MLDINKLKCELMVQMLNHSRNQMWGFEECLNPFIYLDVSLNLFNLITAYESNCILSPYEISKINIELNKIKETNISFCNECNK